MTHPFRRSRRLITRVFVFIVSIRSSPVLNWLDAIPYKWVVRQGRDNTLYIPPFDSAGWNQREGSTEILPCLFLRNFLFLKSRRESDIFAD